MAVADKLDTIAGMFAIDEPPTGSKDPFALRRSAIGVLNILRERLGCGYEALVRAALKLYAEQGLSFDEDAVACAVCSFIHGRMEQMARDEGLSADTVASVSAGSITVPTDFFCLAHALEDARANDAETFVNLATAYARANNLRNAELGSDVDESLINEVEHSLFCAVVQAEGRVERALFEGDFGGVIAELASLRKPIDLFFDRVKVMDDDAALRDNRLRLLNRFVGVFANIADFAVLGK